jgi:hypothetical protein
MAAHNHQFSITDLPEWILSPFKSCFHRLNEEGLILHLSVHGLMQLTHLPDIIGFLSETEEGTSPDSSKRLAEKLQAAERDAEWVQKEALNGFPILHAHSTIALWSILHVTSEDLAIAWLEHTPEAWQIDEAQRIKVPIATYNALEGRDRVRFVVQELAHSRGSGHRSGASALDTVLNLFGLAPPIGQNLRQALHELHQVRNVLVHCGGVADHKLVQECPWLGLQQGETISVPHSLWAWYHLAAERYAERMMNAVILRFGFEGCTCPGMDNVPDRPQSRDHTDDA